MRGVDSNKKKGLVAFGSEKALDQIDARFGEAALKVLRVYDAG